MANGTSRWCVNSRWDLEDHSPFDGVRISTCAFLWEDDEVLSYCSSMVDAIHCSMGPFDIDAAFNPAVRYRTYHHRRLAGHCIETPYNPLAETSRSIMLALLGTADVVFLNAISSFSLHRPAQTILTSSLLQTIRGWFAGGVRDLVPGTSRQIQHRRRWTKAGGGLPAGERLSNRYAYSHWNCADLRRVA
jgi:hypothetical protein